MVTLWLAPTLSLPGEMLTVQELALTLGAATWNATIRLAIIHSVSSATLRERIFLHSVS